MLSTVLEAAAAAADVGILDSCYSTRPPRGTNTSVLGVGLAPQCLLIVMAVVTLIQYKPPLGKRSKRNDFGPTPTFFAYTFALAYAWYLGSYMVVTSLKDILGDTSCSTKANSVSGHYNFHVFLLAIPYLVHSQMVANRIQPPTSWPVKFTHTYFALVAVSLITMFETYYFGYHSLRQLIYGFLFGIASVASFDAMRRRYAWFNGFDYAAEPDIFSSLVCVVALQLSGYLMLQYAGGAQFIGAGDYAFVFALDAVLVVLFLMIPGVRTTTDDNIDVVSRETASEGVASTGTGGRKSVASTGTGGRKSGEGKRDR